MSHILAEETLQVRGGWLERYRVTSSVCRRGFSQPCLNNIKVAPFNGMVIPQKDHYIRSAEVSAGGF